MHYRFSSFILLLLITLISFSFSEGGDNSNSDLKYNNPPFTNCESDWIDSVYNSLSLDAKIAQMFMVAAYSNRDQNHIDEVSELIVKYQVGGVIFFQGGPVRQANITNYFQSISTTPLMIAQDCEWGLGMRLDSVISFPYQMMLGAIQNDQLIYEMGKEIASELKRIGVHTGFSPVMDINNNPRNPVINHRSFGENREKVAAKSYAYMSGLQDESILAFGKHFPGHGDTDSDSHLGLPVISHSKDHLNENELYPFRQLINNGLSGIMVAHLSVSSFDSTNTPSSLSSPILREILKHDLGFEGLIITDALNMEGVKSDDLKSGDLEVQAIIAGNDILLMSEDVPKAIKAIKKAIKKGSISEKEIEESCRKILKAKYWVGLNNYKPVAIDNLYKDLNSNSALVLKQSLIEQSLIVVSNENNLLPLQRLDTLRIASVTIGSVDDSAFNESLSKYTHVDKYNISSQSDSTSYLQVLDSLSGYNLIIIGVSKTSQKPKLNFGISTNSIRFISEISSKKKVILSLFANPYSMQLMDTLISPASTIIAFNDDEMIQKCSSELIFGGIPALGKLPVSISDELKEGYGCISFRKTRLKYSLPEEAGFDSDKLSYIDSIVNNAIGEGAMPGCQVLVARDGIVVYEKSFGYHTYDNSHPVTLSNLYDIASITKITASLPLIMKLYDEKKLDLNKTFGNYLTLMNGSELKDITLKDALCHQGRLQPWIPFYRNTIDDGKYKKGIYSLKPIPGYTTEVVDGLFILDSYKDSIYNAIYISELRKKVEYKYSDMGFYILQQIIEDLTSCNLEDYVDNNFYKELGADNLGYLPLRKNGFNDIIPTENDLEFRHKLVHGYVHDPGAAMLGGVAGHAGVFSNAGDLAKIMQMYLWDGKYGDFKFFNNGTVEYFATSPYLDKGNRRGIGFDKPELDLSKDGPTFQGISGKSFGHTGFTGTMVWADPETGILYIFLSNRVYPDASNTKLIKMNVRTNIQEAIYNALR